MIRGYRWLISPLLGACCRFHPTCSDYALQALSAHGAWKGCWLALRRLLRCHPFSPGGYDPVPPPADGVCYTQTNKMHGENRDEQA